MDVRRASVEALGRLGDGRAVEPLVIALKDEDAGVRRASAAVLGRLGDGRAVEPLVAALKDGDADVRRDIAGALHKLGWQPDRSAAGAAYWVSRREWSKCVEIGAPAVEPLIVALNDRNERINAAGVLGRVGDARAAEPLIATFSYDNLQVRRVAARSLVAIYQRGGLDRSVQERILALRNEFTQRHYDSVGAHEDWGHTSNDCHTDEHPHHDYEGIGISFPI